jgi:rhamnosyltransferase
MQQSPRVGLIIPTLNAGESWNACVQAIKGQSFGLWRTLVVDSASTDRTLAIAESAGFETVRIERSQFNHGGTRQWAADYLADCDIVVFLTQDAILASTESLADIVRCFSDPAVAVAYGRQLPHKSATAIEAHARVFNYGTKTLYKDQHAAEQIGANVFFCSNSFAAYRRSTLLALGGFGRDLILGEDMELAARAIKAGYTNVYCATAPVFHSHDYTAVQTLKRYFDVGVFDGRNVWMRREFGSHGGRGMRFVRSEILYLLQSAPLKIPRAILLTFAKAVGYRLGRLERRLPRYLKVKLSMQPSYWR